MKKVVLTLFTLATLAACSAPEPVNIGGNNAIKFGEVSTRVEDADEIKEFKVYAEMNLGKDGDAAALTWTPLLDGEKVYRDNNNDGLTDQTGDFTYDNTCYWVADRTFFFFGVHPYETEVISTENGGLNGSRSYSIEYGENDTYDLLVAENKTVVTDASYNTAVDMDFTHALCKVSLKVTKNNANKDNTVTLTKAELKYVGNIGTYNHIIGGNCGWTISTETTDYEYTDSTEISTSGTSVFENLMLIPQQASNIQLKLEYELSVGEDTETYNVSAFLPQLEWKPSNVYVYDVKLSPIDNNISFKSPSVSVCGTLALGGSAIIQ